MKRIQIQREKLNQKRGFEQFKMRNPERNRKRRKKMKKRGSES